MTSMLTSSFQRNLGLKMTWLSKVRVVHVSFSQTGKPIHTCKKALTTLINNHSFHSSSKTPTTSISKCTSIVNSNKNTVVKFSTKNSMEPKKDSIDEATGEEEESPIRMRLIPTRHSKHHIPPIAPVDVLHNATDKILNSIPGTLFG